MLTGAISFKDVWFRYAEGDAPALRKVSFEIPAGDQSAEASCVPRTRKRRKRFDHPGVDADQIGATGAKYLVSPCANCKKQLREVCEDNGLGISVPTPDGWIETVKAYCYSPTTACFNLVLLNPKRKPIKPTGCRWKACPRTPIWPGCAPASI